MTPTQKRLEGLRKNKEIQYKAIMAEFEKHNNGDTPIAVIHRKYIYPKFGISRATLYKIFKQEL